jgi:hypothetical protein
VNKPCDGCIVKSELFTVSKLAEHTMDANESHIEVKYILPAKPILHTFLVV